MILEALNQILETDYATEQDAVVALTQPHFVENHTNPSRKFLEIYFGIFNTSPVDSSFWDGYDAVYLLAETYGWSSSKMLYMDSSNTHNYRYDHEMPALKLNLLKRDFETFVSSHNPSISEKERYLTEKFEPFCVIPYQRKNFMEFRVLNYESAQVVKRMTSKYGTTKQRYCMDYFEDGLKVLLPATFIYTLISTLITHPVQERKCLPDKHLNYLIDQLLAMDNPVFNKHWETSRVMTKSAEKLQSFEGGARDLPLPYVGSKLSVADFQKRVAFDSEMALMYLVAGLRFNSISILQYVALLIQSIRDCRARFGII